MEQSIQEVANRLSEAKSVVVVTGAGVSAESKIPTFRDAMDGLWKSFDPMKLATPEAFADDPETVTRWYDFRRAKCLDAIPNPGHVALARMQDEIESRGGSFTLLTQNVDRLHQRAGSHDVVELHGSIMVWRCAQTGRRYEDLPAEFDSYPPRTPEGTLMRPDVVWFGEALPEAALERAFEASAACDLFFSVGTSAVVYPAAGFVDVARQGGARTVEVNRDETPISAGVDWSLRGSSGEILPGIVEGAFPSLGDA